MVRAATPLEDILEKDWSRSVRALAQQLGWTVYHTHDSRKSDVGFPDYVLVRDRVVFLELKREKTRATDKQAGWLLKLAAAGAEVYLARPRHLDQLAKVLGSRGVDHSEARGQLLLELDALRALVEPGKAAA